MPFQGPSGPESIGSTPASAPAVRSVAAPALHLLTFGSQPVPAGGEAVTVLVDHLENDLAWRRIAPRGQSGRHIEQPHREKVHLLGHYQRTGIPEQPVRTRLTVVNEPVVGELLRRRVAVSPEHAAPPLAVPVHLTRSPAAGGGIHPGRQLPELLAFDLSRARRIAGAGGPVRLRRRM